MQVKQKSFTKKFQIRTLFLVITFLFVNLGFGKVVHAKETGEVGYNIQAVLPENQKDKNNTYFDLRMSPGQKQTIEIMINNTSVEDTTYEISINQAYTNDQGFIDYTDSEAKLDSSLPYKINDIVSYEKEVAVKAQESTKFPVTIQMPDTSFDGQIMAGIQVMKKEKEESNAGVTSKIGYILGLNITETDTEIKRELSLVSVEPEASFGKTSVVATVKNPTMEAYGKLKYAVVVTDATTGKEVRSVTYDSGMQLAPNSIYGLAIDWDGKRLIAGEYKLNLIVTDAKENKWAFDEKFSISKEQAKDINKITVDRNQEAGIPWWVYLILAIVVIILVIVFIIFLKKKREKQRQEELKKQQAKKKRIAKKKAKDRKKNKARGE